MPQMCRQEPERSIVWVKCLMTLFNISFSPPVGLQLDRMFKERSKRTRAGGSNMAKATISRNNGLVTLV
jgi:hypothetical protein